MKSFKSIFALMMVFFLMFSNIGLALNVHYCGGVVDKIILSYPHIDLEEDSCELEAKTIHNCCADKEEISKEETCCKDHTLTQDTSEKVVVKILQLSSEFAVLPEITNLVFNAFAEYAIPKKEAVAFYCDSNAPPFYTLYHQFIFYA